MDRHDPGASAGAGPAPGAGMYTAHFGLRLLPFENVPDPAFFFNAGEYQRVLQRLTSAIDAGRGLLVVAGPIGSGKTTLSQKLMAGLPQTTAHLWLAEPPGDDRELFQMLMQRLGGRFTWESRVLALGELRDRLLAHHGAGGRFLLVIDESHKFTDAGLESIRLLNNLEQGATKLIQVLMLGQEELTEMLTRAGREPFRQRIANLELLGRMPPPQLCDYVRHRVRVAGGEPGIFPDPILDAVAASCGGIPRLTNSLCDRALLHAFDAGRRAVAVEDLLHGAEEVGVYRKAFHFLVGREGAQGEAPAPNADHRVQPGQPGGRSAKPERCSPPPAALVQAPPAAPVATDPEPADGPASPPPRLTGSLVFLATGVAALALSLLWYCSRAAAVSGGDCLVRLVHAVTR